MDVKYTLFCAFISFPNIAISLSDGNRPFIFGDKKNLNPDSLKCLKTDAPFVADKIILGIDPGTQILGFGIVHVLGKSVRYVNMGVINLKKEKDHFVTLKTIMEQVTLLIEKYSPDELAIEAPFYGKNPQVMLKLGRAQGAAIAAALQKEIPILNAQIRALYDELDRKFHLSGAKIPIRFGLDKDLLGSYTRASYGEEEHFHFSLYFVGYSLENPLSKENWRHQSCLLYRRYNKWEI